MPFLAVFGGEWAPRPPTFTQLCKIFTLKDEDVYLVDGEVTNIKITYPYDLKLVSIHQNGRFDYMDDQVLTMDKFKVATMYFDQMLQVLKSFPDGHILTHFEYGLRRFDFSAQELEEHFEATLRQIFELVIQRELAFEVNAKSFGRYQNAPLYEYAIPLYQSLGGKLFTLGSDAHVAQDYRLLFPEMSQLLRKFDVNQLVVFQGNERYLTDLPN